MNNPLFCELNRYPHPHLAEPAPLNIKSMFECEVLAIYRAFQQTDSYAREKGGVAKNICIFVDNLEAKLRIEACLAEKHGSTILEILSSSTARVRKMLSGIKELAEVYDSVQLRWIRSHTSGGSLAEIGNDRADKLAKVMMMIYI